MCAVLFAWQITPVRHHTPLDAGAITPIHPARELDHAPGAATSPAGGTSAVASAKATAAALTAALGGEPTIQRIERDNDVPAFDVARVEADGEAVIAGRAAPGATVELLRDGRVHDHTVANQSGEFVLVPKPLPPGNYDLTLRSTLPEASDVEGRRGRGAQFGQG